MQNLTSLPILNATNEYDEIGPLFKKWNKKKVLSEKRDLSSPTYR